VAKDILKDWEIWKSCAGDSSYLGSFPRTSTCAHFPLLCLQ